MHIWMETHSHFHWRKSNFHINKQTSFFLFTKNSKLIIPLYNINLYIFFFFLRINLYIFISHQWSMSLLFFFSNTFAKHTGLYICMYIYENYFRTEISSKPVWRKFLPTHIKWCQVSKYLMCTLNIRWSLITYY